MAPGNYTGIFGSAIETAPPAVRIFIHGHGARITGGNADVPLLRTKVPTEIYDLELVSTEIEGQCLVTTSATTIERVTFRGGRPLTVQSATTVIDSEIDATHTGIGALNTSLTLDRVRIGGGQIGIDAYNVSVDLTNVLVSETSVVGINLEQSDGLIKFTTLANTGRSATGVFDVHCVATNLTLQGSIVWNNFAAARPPIDGSCTQFVNTIAGPAMVSGALNMNPEFVNAVSGDFHLTATSPARDRSDTGPTLDLDRVARPKGVRFDLGAFEAP